MLLYVFDRGRSAASIEERLAASAIMSDLARNVHNLHGIRCQTRMVRGAPHEKIMEASEEFNADLIVLGAHRRNIQDAFLSTTAERALRRSRLPMLMVNTVPAGQYRRIVLAVDFTDHAEFIIHSAQKLGLLEAADIFALHAFEPKLGGPILRAGMTLQQERQHMDARELAATKELTALLRRHGLDTTANLLPPAIPSAATAIIECARRIQADLIVLGSENATPIRQWLLGSVAQAFMRAGHVDTLIIPSSAQRPTRPLVEDRHKSNAAS
jgi:nucleotide-binding universal stress UspA family protein